MLGWTWLTEQIPRSMVLVHLCNVKRTRLRSTMEEPCQEKLVEETQQQ